MIVKKPSTSFHQKLASVTLSVLLLGACSNPTLMSNNTVIDTTSPTTMKHIVADSVLQRLVINVDNPENYAKLSLYANGQLLVDKLNVPRSGQQVLTALVRFDALGEVELKFVANRANLTVNSIHFETVMNVDLPVFQDISEKAGLDKVSSIKYGGPTVADIDNDGDYDFIVNNHNQESSKLYWNNGDGTVSKHKKNLSRWFMQDLHGTSAGDYDNDGDLDLMLTLGGGNGENPTISSFYKNDNGNFILYTGDVGINKGGRGRGPKWSDMDLDGDLDLMLINETSIHGAKPQHFFHENLGDGTFRVRPIPNVENQHASRALVTDLNGDNIDDLVLYGPLSIWQGNGDFTYTDVTYKIPAALKNVKHILAVADADIDNDGDLDLYLATSTEFEFFSQAPPALDHDPLTQQLSIKPKGNKGVDAFDFEASGDITFDHYRYLARGGFNGKTYPILLGSEKTAVLPVKGEALVISPETAKGWPEDMSDNGIYLGYMGKGQWKATLVRDKALFWNFKFNLSGVNKVTPKFIPKNRNSADFLLRNDGDSFTDVSKEWQIPEGINSFGVTTGDFNNDTHQDFFVYRWGDITGRISDYMLLNTGNGKFDVVTMHGANDVGGPGNGDMGQAFDFDLDGDLDLLNGSENGEWYLYENTQPGKGNYALVRVGYSPKENVDAYSAEVIVNTDTQSFRKRVGSAGEVFSQSLLNTVHFGLADAQSIKSIQVRWRNGETAVFTNKPVNTLFSTDSLDPSKLSLSDNVSVIRQGSTIPFSVTASPKNASNEVQWASSNESILSVDQAGQVSAIGNVNETASITATSSVNGISDKIDVNIVEWKAKPLETLSFATTTDKMFVSEHATIALVKAPQHADSASIIWRSSAPEKASVDAQGRIVALQAGTVTIKASVKNNPSVYVEQQIDIAPFVAPYLKVLDEEALSNGELIAGDDIIVEVEYHAGSGNHVIASDQGGMRFWFRHFASKYKSINDIKLVDAEVLKSESGKSTMKISLKDLEPVLDLPEGHTYQLRISFTSSNGTVLNKTIMPLNIVAPK